MGKNLSVLVWSEGDLSVLEQLLVVFRDVRDPLFFAACHAEHSFGERRQHGLHLLPILECVPDFHIVFRSKIYTFRVYLLLM